MSAEQVERRGELIEAGLGLRAQAPLVEVVMGEVDAGRERQGAEPTEDARM